MFMTEHVVGRINIDNSRDHVLTTTSPLFQINAGPPAYDQKW
jgi:hypothetical protein